jgi:hypothetical protein
LRGSGGLVVVDAHHGRVADGFFQLVQIIRYLVDSNFFESVASSLWFCEIGWIVLHLREFVECFVEEVFNFILKISINYDKIFSDFC